MGFRNLGARLAAISTQGGDTMEKVTAASNMTKQSEVYSWLLGLKNQGYTNCIFVYTGDDRTNNRCLCCATSASAPLAQINRYYNGAVAIFSISASGSNALYINSGDEFAVFRF